MFYHLPLHKRVQLLHQIVCVYGWLPEDGPHKRNPYSVDSPSVNPFFQLSSSVFLSMKYSFVYDAPKPCTPCAQAGSRCTVSSKIGTPAPNRFAYACYQCDLRDGLCEFALGHHHSTPEDMATLPAYDSAPQGPTPQNSPSLRDSKLIPLPTSPYVLKGFLISLPFSICSSGSCQGTRCRTRLSFQYP